MNRRQKQILLLFLQQSQHIFSVQDIVDQFQCSEKTVRNDCKQIDEWLGLHTSLRLVRKPSVGIFLEGESKELQRVRSSFQKEIGQTPDISKETRQYKIMYHLLKQKQSYTIEDFTNMFYVSKEVIKKDLSEIVISFNQYHIKLIQKQKTGIKIEGKERDVRTALSKTTKYLIQQDSKTFYRSEIEQIHEIVKRTMKKESISLTDESIENIAMHVFVAIQRIKTKHSIQMNTKERTEIENYPEYKSIRQFITEIEKRFVVKFPKEEIAYCVLHIGSGKTPHSLQDEEEKHRSFVKQLISSVESYTGIFFTTDEQLFHSLQTHIRASFRRLEHGLRIENPMEQDIRRMYPYMFESVISALTTCNQSLSFSIPKEEAAYISLHFQAALERLARVDGNHKKIAIVCTMGMGISQLLKTKIERKFHSIDVVACIAKHELRELLETKEIDFLISNVDLESITVPYLKISPLFPKSEEERLQTFLENECNTDVHYPTIKELVKEDLIFIQEKGETKEEILRTIGEYMEGHGYVHSGFTTSMLEREKLSSTAIGNGIAIPHGNPEQVKKASIALLVFEESIDWGDDFVSLAFVLSYDVTETEKIPKLFQEINDITERNDFIEKIKQAKNKTDIYHCF